MDPQPQQFACPFCNGAFLCQVPNAAPLTVQCPHCAKAVTIAPVVPVAPHPMAAPAAPAAPSDPGEPLTSVGTAATEPAPRPSPEAEPGQEAPSDVPPRRVAVPTRLIAAVLGLSAVAVAGWGVTKLLTRPSGDATVTPAPDGQGSSGTGPKLAARPAVGERSSHWTDATKGSQRLGVYQVGIPHAELGPVLGRDSANAVVPLADACLQITVEVRNTSKIPVDYQSWYGTSVREGGTVTVDLTDDAGNEYPLQAFGEDQKIRGYTPKADLEPSQRVNDVLVFFVPPEVDRSKVKNFFLWLGGAAQGADGNFQFRIPASMITNW